ncbi:hypothetical protein HK405_015879, partial [Cladochytrium tenue]
PLPRVWVWKRSRAQLRALVTTQPLSFGDFVQRNPETASAAVALAVAAARGAPAAAVAASAAAIRDHRRRLRCYLRQGDVDAPARLMRRACGVRRRACGHVDSSGNATSMTAAASGVLGEPIDARQLQSRWARTWSEYEEDVDEDDEDSDGGDGPGRYARLSGLDGGHRTRGSDSISSTYYGGGDSDGDDFDHDDDVEEDDDDADDDEFGGGEWGATLESYDDDGDGDGDGGEVDEDETAARAVCAEGLPPEVREARVEAGLVGTGGRR